MKIHARKDAGGGFSLSSSGGEGKGRGGHHHTNSTFTEDRRLGHASLPMEAMESAFTLIEVMIAITIFFMAMFAILGVLASGVRAATLLRNDGPTAGMVASQLSVTNKLEEGSQSGTFEDIGVYKDYRWQAELREVATNGLFQVDIGVFDGRGNQVSTLSALLYRPDSQNSRMGLQSPR